MGSLVLEVNSAEKSLCMRQAMVTDINGRPLWKQRASWKTISNHSSCQYMVTVTIDKSPLDKVKVVLGCLIQGTVASPVLSVMQLRFSVKVLVSFEVFLRPIAQFSEPDLIPTASLESCRLLLQIGWEQPSCPCAFKRCDNQLNFLGRWIKDFIKRTTNAISIPYTDSIITILVFIDHFVSHSFLAQARRVAPVAVGAQTPRVRSFGFSFEFLPSARQFSPNLPLAYQPQPQAIGSAEHVLLDRKPEMIRPDNNTVHRISIVLS